MTVTRPVCKFRCQDMTCLQSWTFVCNGMPDCPDKSDEIHCPLSLVSSNSHYSSPSFSGLQNVSAIQIIVVAVSVVFTLGLITCVLSHYKMGARSWSERRNRSSPHKTLSRDLHHYFHISHCPQNLNMHCLASISPSQMQKIVFAPAGVQEKSKDSLNKSVQTDITLDLPSTVTMPDGEEYPYINAKTLQIRDKEQESEIYRNYIKPPPNRTVSELNVLAPSKSCSNNVCYKHFISHSGERTTTDNRLTSQLKSPNLNSVSSTQLSCHHLLSSQSPNLCLVSVSSDLNGTVGDGAKNLTDHTEETPPPSYSEVMENINYNRPITYKETGSGV